MFSVIICSFSRAVDYLCFSSYFRFNCCLHLRFWNFTTPWDKLLSPSLNQLINFKCTSVCFLIKCVCGLWIQIVRRIKWWKHNVWTFVNKKHSLITELKFVWDSHEKPISKMRPSKLLSTLLWLLISFAGRMKGEIYDSHFNYIVTTHFGFLLLLWRR